MIEKLQKIFPDLIIYRSQAGLDSDNFYWFTTDSREIFGIGKQDITEKEYRLLETFLTPYQASQTPASKVEKEWMDILFHGQDSTLLTNAPSNGYRFISFHVSDENVDHKEFREAIGGFFPRELPILWQNSNEGLLIEIDPDDTQESIESFQQITDVLMSDFYMKVNLFISPFFSDVSRARGHYQWVENCFQTVRAYRKDPILTYVEAIPYLLLDQLDKKEASPIITSVFKDTEDDKELLSTIQTFLECNSNTTLAAKTLYMHRNSLQYRVDKFIEKTGIDVKEFKGALTVYLAMLLRQNI
ncbi:PucR family transcriptional regulator [Sediminibacillus massiliensis]|uniref:PucR family transcriptional regulator n=1 Tax=Sediminibacillus massiliensis TaxID=1926277 RepID=UPI00098834D9|nr:helix-turn-helix domain-containing protein [Sediminibacillus massiliensis]